MNTQTGVLRSEGFIIGAVSLAVFAAGMLVATPAYAASDYFIKLDGVKGETTKTTTAEPTRATEVTTANTLDAELTRTTTTNTAGTVAQPTGTQEAGGDVYMKIDTIKGESSQSTPGVEPDEIDVAADGGAAKKGGKVEVQWKVEEGQKGAPETGTPRDVSAAPLETMPDFAILLGGSEGQSDEERAQGLERARDIILENARAADQAVEQISLNYEKITTRVRHEVKLFGFIPVQTNAEVDIDVSQGVKVHFPWWVFLSTGADEVAVGERVFQTISNVLKTKHDTIKNSINNVR